MYFKNINNNQIAAINDNLLIEKYKHDKQWIQTDSCIVNEKNNVINPNAARMEEVKYMLGKISEDIIQAQVGENVPNLIEKKETFIKLHNELRILEGKQPR